MQQFPVFVVVAVSGKKLMEIGLEHQLQIKGLFGRHRLEMVEMQQILGAVHGVVELEQIADRTEDIKQRESANERVHGQ